MSPFDEGLAAQTDDATRNHHATRRYSRATANFGIDCLYRGRGEVDRHSAANISTVVQAQIVATTDIAIPRMRWRSDRLPASEAEALGTAISVVRESSIKRMCRLGVSQRSVELDETSKACSPNCAPNRSAGASSAEGRARFRSAQSASPERARLEEQRRSDGNDA